MKLSIFQPWSEFVMRGTLPEEITSKLIELTDIIIQDVEKVSNNHNLAGEIKDEWQIDIPLLQNVGFQPFLVELIKEYIRLVKIQSRPTNTHLECSDEYFLESNSFFEEIIFLYLVISSANFLISTSISLIPNAVNF